MSEMPQSRVPLRRDCMRRVVRYDEQRGAFDISLRPDPDKCEWVILNGKRHLHHKLNDAYFTEEEVQEFACSLVDGTLSGAAIDHAVPALSVDYNKAGIQEQLEELASPLVSTPLNGDVAHKYLTDLGVQELDFVILSVDIAGSTKLATTLGRDQYTHLIMMALDEIGAPVPEFSGKILKYTGDGLIAYFAEPSHAMENDLVLDCALAIREVVYGMLNDFLESSGFPRIEVRVGIDSGFASVVTLGTPQTRVESDLIGATVSLAAKMQQLAEAGKVLIGEMAYQRLQPHWQARCSEITLPWNWEYTNQAGEQYSVYSLSLDDRAVRNN